MIHISVAYIVDLLIGDPHWFPHPVRFIGKYIIWFETFIRRFVKSNKVLKVSGILLTLTTVISTYAIAYFILTVSKEINIWLYHFTNVLLMYTCIATKSLYDESMKVYKELNSNNIYNARKMLSYIVGRDTEHLDEREITRATVETVAENTSDGVVAPLFYMFIGGAPLALAYKAANTLDSMVGYKNERFIDFGWSSAKFDDLVNYIPARLTALFMVIASMFLKLDYKESFRIIIRDRKNHSSPNCGYPEAATAGAMGVVLGGTNMYFGRPVIKPTMGDGKRLLNKDDIILVNKLMYTVSLITIIILSMTIFLLRGELL